MALTTEAFQTQVGELREQAHHTLLGAVKAASEKDVLVLRNLSTADWQTAARSLLLHRRTSVLSALSEDGLTAVAHGHIDMAVLTRRAVDVAAEHSMQQAITEIAGRRFKLDLEDEHEAALHSLSTADLGDALMEAYAAGRQSVTL